MAAGVYEVVWSLFLTSIGASIVWIGLTFVLFGLPVLILSPLTGRLVDRSSPLLIAAIAGLVYGACGILYSVATEPVFPALVIPFEGTAVAFLGPALYVVLASGTPHGRTGTAQGLYGGAGQVGIIVASLAAGSLFAIDPRWPFWFFTISCTIAVVLGLAIAWRARPLRLRAVATAATVAGCLMLVGCGATPPVSPTASASPSVSPGPSDSPIASPGPTGSPVASASPTPIGPPTPTPARTAFSYTIQTGDALSLIAVRFGVTVSQILAANPQITDPDHVEVGDVITIPPPDAPSGLPEAASIDDAFGDQVDDHDNPVFAPGYVDIAGVDVSVDATYLIVEIRTVATPIATDPDVEPIEYDAYVDTNDDGQPNFEFKASNTLDPSRTWAAVVIDLATNAASQVDDFPGSFTVGSTVRFQVDRNVLGDTREYRVAVIVQRHYYVGGVGDPEVEISIDRAPDQQWPNANARWVEVGR